MSLDKRACHGPCASRAREAWAAYDQALTAWLHDAANAINKATQDAQTTTTIPEPSDLTPRQIHALKLPERPAEPDVPYNLGEPWFCGARCRPRIRRALDEVDRLASLLDSWADGHRGATSGEKVSRSSSAPASPSPISVILDTLYQEVTDMEDEWREARGYSKVRRGTSRGAHGRTLAIAFILDHFTDIFLSEDHVEFCLRVLTWERLLLAQTKSDPVVRSRPGRCPRCRLVNTLQTRDDGITECTSCGRLLSEPEYERDVLHVVDYQVVEDSKKARA
jgi:ribosomal protein L37AE/L43A